MYSSTKRKFTMSVTDVLFVRHMCLFDTQHFLLRITLYTFCLCGYVCLYAVA